MMALRCINNFRGRCVLEDVTPERVNEYVRKTCTEYYEIPPDAVIFRDTLISLESPMLVGFRRKKRKVLLPFTRRCRGTCLIEIPATEEDFEFFLSCSREPR
jgi:hypothetical protein